MVVKLPHVGQLCGKTIIVILKVFWEDPRKGIGILYLREICTGRQQAYYILGFHQKAGNLETLNTESDYLTLWFIKNICLLSFPPGWPFLPQVQQTFMTNYCILQELARNCLFCLLQSYQTLKVRLFPLSDSNSHPRWLGESNKEDDPHMNICAVLIKDLKEHKAKPNLMAKLGFLD